jgi:DNA-binding CsgD family transcriptional regulator/catechol 2,3-dioxygenase-like lactoylglutathione lyase family enzyme
MARRGRGRPSHPDVLTPAEWQVIDLVRHGLSRHAIAERRGTSANAVKYHVANIRSKLGVSGHAALRHWPGYPVDSAIAHRQEDSAMTTETLRLGPVGQVSLYARDVAQAEGFYRDTLGLAHIFTFGDLAFFDMGGVRLYVHAVGDEQWRAGSLIYFLVDDIHAAYEELGSRGVRQTAAPHNIYTDEVSGTEEWMAFFEDPDGNALALMSRVGRGGAQ